MKGYITCYIVVCYHILRILMTAIQIGLCTVLVIAMNFLIVMIDVLYDISLQATMNPYLFSYYNRVNGIVVVFPSMVMVIVSIFSFVSSNPLGWDSVLMMTFVRITVNLVVVHVKIFSLIFGDNVPLARKQFRKLSFFFFIHQKSN